MIKQIQERSARVEKLERIASDAHPKFTARLFDFQREHGLIRFPEGDRMFDFSTGRSVVLFAFGVDGEHSRSNHFGMGLVQFDEGEDSFKFAEFFPVNDGSAFEAFIRFFEFLPDAFVDQKDD